MTIRVTRDHGRRTLLLMLALIFTGEVAAGILIDYAPMPIRFPRLAEILESSRHLGSSKSILFFGSSRFASAISTDAIKQVLRDAKLVDGIAVSNAAIAASDPVAMDFETERLLDVGIRPVMVVVEILPEVLTQRNLWLHFHLGRQFRWRDVWNFLPDAYLAGALPVVVATRFNAVYTFRSEFQQWTLDSLGLRFGSAAFTDGAAQKRSKWAQPADVEFLARGAAFGRKNVRGYKIGGLNARALVRMIERYSKLGTKLVFIAPPVSSPYRGAYTRPINNAYLAYMSHLRKTYGTYFFDYRHRLADHYFWSAYYTTLDGRNQFSRMLAREVIVPLIAGTKSLISPSDAPTTAPENRPAREVRSPSENAPRRGG